MLGRRRLVIARLHRGEASIIVSSGVIGRTVNGTSGLERSLLIRRCREIREHLMTWGTNIIGRERVFNCQFRSRLGKARISIPKDTIVVCEEHREDWRRDIESWGEDNAHVPNRHLVHIGIVHNLDQELR